MINRIIQKKCRELFKKYPVLTITGPRQSGKTTLAKALFGHKPYVSLEDPDQRHLAKNDPRGFLKNYPRGAILDEIQRAPEIVSYIQSIVDNANKSGIFVLTGSQQLEISQTISQSLAGRTALVKLLPLSLSELHAWQSQQNLNKLMLNGFYPRVYNKKIKPYDFYSNYFETYIERDLRQLSNIENLHTFEKFVKLLAGRTGQLLNYNNLANDLGVSQPTIRKWISILEASYIIFLLPPFYRNIRKRLVKTPKLYFYDTGLVSYLMGIENTTHLKTHPLRGNIFENFVVMEFLKERFNQGKKSNLYYYRDRSGNEVDLILQQANYLHAIEIKSAETINLDFCKNIKKFKSIFTDEVKQQIIMYGGDDKYVHQNIKFLPWNFLNRKKII
jgi:uncharacterized protein